MSDFILKVSCQEQTLKVFQDGNRLNDYMIATATKGMGELKDSEQTPRGWHIIRAKIGANCQANTVFLARRPTGEYYTPALKIQYPDRDWILTRILWLSGLERGKNRLGLHDTMQRYIYIHGAPDDVVLGIPSSHGCIRMHNHDIIQLFDFIPVGTKLLISA